MESVAIIGAGVTGLSTAHYLRQLNFTGQIDIYYEGKPGGNVQSLRHQDCLLELGPETWLAKTPIFWELAEQLNIVDQIILPNQYANKRYVLREGFLSPVPKGPMDFLFGSLLFITEKYKLFKAMKRPLDVWERQTLFDAAVQVGGYDFAESLGSAFTHGIFGCDAKQIEFSSAFPALYKSFQKKMSLKKTLKENRKIPAEWQNKYSAFANQSFNKGLVSFQQGLGQLIDGFIEQHQDKKIKMQSLSVKSIKKDGTKLIVQAGSRQGVSYDRVVYTGSAASIEKVCKSMLPETGLNAPDLTPTPITVVHSAWQSKDLNMNAFGFLCSKKEKQSILGALFSSRIFANRSPDDIFLTKIMVPGNSDVFADDEVADRAATNLARIMKIKASPVWSRVQRVPGGIPRYMPGFSAFRAEIRKNLEPNHVYSAGWHYSPVGIQDCAEAGKSLAEQIL